MTLKVRRASLRVCSESPGGAIGRSQGRQPLDWGPSPESIPLAAATSGKAGGCGGEWSTRRGGVGRSAVPQGLTPLATFFRPPSGASGTDSEFHVKAIDDTLTTIKKIGWAVAAGFSACSDRVLHCRPGRPD